jgi:uncharacterized RmlC-like cupin family protein
MSSSKHATCHIVRPSNTTYAGKLGFSYFEGIAKQTVSSRGICMHLLTIPLGGRAKAHMHDKHETVIYALSGSRPRNKLPLPTSK